MIKRTLVLGIAIFIISASSLFAAGELRGAVKTPEGTLMPGVLLTLIGGTPVKTIGPLATNMNGEYRFTALDPGEYTLKVDAGEGYMRMEIKVRVFTTDITRHDITLLYETKEEKTVIAVAPPVKVSPKAETTISPEMVATLPAIGNTYQDLAKLAPGVSITADGEIVIKAQRPSETRVLLDNVSVSDPFGIIGTNPLDISTDAIQEIQIISGGFDASMFGVQGGEVRLITKEGKNEREGSVSVTALSSIFDRHGGRRWQYPSNYKFHRYEPAFTLGGPFIKDEFWYFANVIYQSIKSPGVNRIETTKEYRNYTREIEGIRTALLKLTYQLNDYHKLTGGYTHGNIIDSKYVNIYWPGTFVPPASDIESQLQYHTFSLDIASVFSKKGAVSNPLRLDTTLSFFKYFYDAYPLQLEHPSRPIPCSLIGLWTEPDQFVICEGDQALGPFMNRRYINIFEELTLKEKFTKFVDNKWGGDHKFTFGLEWRNAIAKFDWRREPTFAYDPLSPGMKEQKVTVSYLYNQPRTDELTVSVLYIQDDFDISRRWQISAGLNLADQSIKTFAYKPEPLYSDFQNSGFPGSVPGRDPMLNENCLQVTHLLSTDDDDYWNPKFAGTENPNPRWARCWEVHPGGFSFIGIDSAENLIPGLFNYLASAETISYGGMSVSPMFSTTWKPYGDEDTVLTFYMGRRYGLIANTAGWETQTASTYSQFKEAQIRDKEYDSPASYSLSDFYILDRDIEIPYTDEYSFRIGRNITPVLGASIRYTNNRGYKQVYVRDINLTYDKDGEPASRKNKNFRQILYASNYETRKFESVEIEVTKRAARNWELLSSYMYQKSSGVGEQFYEPVGDPKFAYSPSIGPTEEDQTHTVKISLVNHLPAQFRIGTIVFWNSGLPYSLIARSGGSMTGALYEIHEGGRNAFRNPAHWRVDMSLIKDFKWGKGTGSVEFKVENILNDPYLYDQFIRYSQYSEGAGIFRGGGEAGGTGGLITSTNDFVPYLDFGRSWQVTFRYKF